MRKGSIVLASLAALTLPSVAVAMNEQGVGSQPASSELATKEPQSLPKTLFPAREKIRLPVGAIMSVWIVEPTVPASAPISVEVGPGDIVFKQRLLPVGLAVLKAPILNEKGEVLVNPDEQLFEVLSDIPVYCAFNARNRTFGEWMVSTGTDQRRLCLTDADRNGSFEGAFEARSPSHGIPKVRGKRPENQKSIVPVEYEIADPASVLDTYYVGVVFGKGTYKSLLSKREWFSVHTGFGRESGLISISDHVTVLNDKLPQSMNFLGSNIVVLELEDERAAIRIDDYIPTQIFDIVKKICSGSFCIEG